MIPQPLDAKLLEVRDALLLLRRKLLRQLALLLGVVRRHDLLPVAVPRAVAAHQLGPQQQVAGLLGQVELAPALRPQPVPRRPPARELLVHHALEALIAQLLHSLLALALELLLHQTRRARGAGHARVDDPLRVEQLLAKLVNLGGERLLQLAVLGLHRRQLLLVRHRRLRVQRRAPVAAPMRKARHQLWARQAARHLGHHLPLAHVLGIQPVPRVPPLEEALIAQPLHAELLQVRHALLSLRLERLRHLVALALRAREQLELTLHLVAHAVQLEVGGLPRLFRLGRHRARRSLLRLEPLEVGAERARVLAQPVALEHDRLHAGGEGRGPLLAERGDGAGQLEDLGHRAQPLHVAQLLLELRPLLEEGLLDLLVLRAEAVQRVLECRALLGEGAGLLLLPAPPLGHLHLELLARAAHLEHRKLLAHALLDAQPPLVLELPLRRAQDARRRAQLGLEVVVLLGGELGGQRARRRAHGPRLDQRRVRRLQLQLAAVVQPPVARVLDERCAGVARLRRGHRRRRRLAELGLAQVVPLCRRCARERRRRRRRAVEVRAADDADRRRRVGPARRVAAPGGRPRRRERGIKLLERLAGRGHLRCAHDGGNEHRPPRARRPRARSLARGSR